MVTQTLKALYKSLNSPDETRLVGNGKIDFAHLEETTIARITLRPGWKWSRDVRPIAQTESCQTPHIQYVIGGRLLVAMDDGSRFELGPGDAAVIPPGHDAWVLGDEPFVAIDFTGMKEYAKKP